jgi:hypothetical protein
MKMKPTDQKPESPDQQNAIEVLAGKPGHGSSRVVLIDGEGDKPAQDGTFIGKNDHMTEMDAMVRDFIHACDSHKIFSPDDAPIDGTSIRVVFTDGEDSKYAIDVEQDVTALPKLDLDADEHLNSLGKKFLDNYTMGPIEHAYFDRAIALEKEMKRPLADILGDLHDTVTQRASDISHDFAVNEWAKWGANPMNDEEKAAFNKEFDDALNERIKNPHDPVAKQRLKDLTAKLRQGQTGKGEVWLDPLQSADFHGKTVVIDGISRIDDALTAVLSPATHAITYSLEDWIDLKQKSSDGFDPVLKDFVRANAEKFDPNKFEGEGVTLRTVSHASDLLRTVNHGRQEFPEGSTWVAPKQILAAVLSPEMADDLIQFAQGKGLEVDTQAPKKPEVGVENDVDSPKL